MAAGKSPTRRQKSEPTRPLLKRAGVEKNNIKRRDDSKNQVKEPAAKTIKSSQQQRHIGAEKKPNKKEEKTASIGDSLPEGRGVPGLRVEKRKREDDEKDWSSILRSKKLRLAPELEILPEDAKHRVAGFTNLTGVECYRSSLMHALCNTPQFVNLLFQYHRPETCVSELRITKLGTTICTCISCHMYHMASKYWSLPGNQKLNRYDGEGKALKNSAQIESLQKTIQLLFAMSGWKHSYPTQEDPSEQFTFILEKMAEEFPSDVKERLDAVNELTLKGSFTCPNPKCKKMGVTITNDRALNLDPRACKPATLPNLIGKTLADETITEYKCESCARIGDITRSTKLVYCPPILQVQLQRFDFLGKKVFDKVDFPEQLNLSKYTVDGKKHEYELYSVVSHGGYGLNGGHFINFTRVEGKGWVEFDDSTVTRNVSFSTVLGTKRFTPYLLFYKQK